MIDFASSELFGAPLAHDARRYRSPAERAEKVLRPVRANAGVSAEYRRQLTVLIDAMCKSTLRHVSAAYRANEPEVARLAADESPAAMLKAAIKRLVAQWTKNFDEAAPRLAAWFATAAKNRSEGTLRRILKDGGFTVEWRMSRPMNDAMQATIAEQVGLIKSIPSRHFAQIEGLVMRSVAQGRKLSDLTDDLQEQFGVSRRRAALIARDQNNKATATLTRVRQLEAGIDEAIWVHSGGGHEPRPSHAKAGRDRTRYKVSEGWFDPHEQKFIFPGELINCRCVSRPVIKGFT